MWNFIDMSRNLGYILVITLRTIAYYQQQEEIKINPASAYIPREEWDDFDPQLVADGLFAMSNVFRCVYSSLWLNNRDVSKIPFYLSSLALMFKATLFD
jgi:hypothetical protein